jgi:HAE1 family hydrophobic/amphiphilic exporter-1
VRLLKACAEHPCSVLMVAAAFLLFGMVALGQIDIELLPALPLPVAHVITEYEDIPAPEVEELLTVCLENALSSVKGVKKISSISKRGISRISLFFDWSVDIELSAVEVREKIDSLYPLLPQGCAKPLVLTEDANEQPLMILAAFPAAADRPARQPGLLLQRELKSRLLQINGVADVRMVGVEEAEIMVEADAFKLYDSGLLVQNLADTLQCSVYDQPVGLVREGKLEVPLKISSGVQTLQDLAGIPLPGLGAGGGLTLGDVATVSRGVKDRTSFFHYNGREAVGIYLYKTGSLGSLNAAAGIRKELLPLRELFAGEIRLELIEDRSVRIRQSIRSLLLAILLGTAAAAGVLLLVARTPLPALLTISSIPVSLSAAFLGMWAGRISLNIISLSGMAMGIGLIVDNAIVVLEYLCRRRPRSPAEIARCALAMSAPAFGSTATTLLVFLPLVFIPGMIGPLFKDLALTISFLLAASYLAALTLMPALYSLAKNRLRAISFRTAALEGPYRRTLCRLFRKPAAAAFAFLLMLAAGFLCLRLLPKEPLPAAAPGVLRLDIRTREGLRLEDTAAWSSEIESSLLALPEVEAVCAAAGFDKSSLKDRSAKQTGTNRLWMRIYLSREGIEASEQVTQTISGRLPRRGGLTYRLFRPAEQVEALLGFSDSLTLLLTGPVREELLARAGQISALCSERGLASSVELDTRPDTPEARLILNREAMAFNNLEVQVVQKTLNAAVRGVVPARLHSDDEDTDIRVRLKQEYTDSADKLRRLRIPSPAGALELSLLADLRQTLVCGELYRLNRKPAVEISFLPAPSKRRELKTFLKEFQTADIILTSLSELASSRRQMINLLLLALALMYLIVGAQFESLTVGLLVLLSLPLSMSGSLALLYVTGKSVNLNSFLGLLILLGISLNTTILLAASYNGREARLADVIRGSVSRLTPILATSLTTVCALLPLLFFGELQSHMAAAVIGGLLSGTLASLLFFPLAYFRVQGPLRRRRAGRENGGCRGGKNAG